MVFSPVNFKREYEVRGWNRYHFKQARAAQTIRRIVTQLLTHYLTHFFASQDALQNRTRLRVKPMQSTTMIYAHMCTCTIMYRLLWEEGCLF